MKLIDYLLKLGYTSERSDYRTFSTYGKVVSRFTKGSSVFEFGLLVFGLTPTLIFPTEHFIHETEIEPGLFEVSSMTQQEIDRYIDSKDCETLFNELLEYSKK